MCNKTGIVILNYNNASDTIGCIDSVTGYSDLNNIKLIVVDNGSRVEIAEKVGTYLKHKFSSYTEYNEMPNGNTAIELTTVSYLRLHNNIGYAKGNNAGAYLLFKDKSIEYIMILNSDILFTANIIPTLIQDVETLKDAAIVSPLLRKKGSNTIDYNCARKAPSLFQIFISNLACFGNLFGIQNHIRRKQYILHQEPTNGQNIIEIELPSGSCMLMKKALFEHIGAFDPNTFLYYEENIIWAKIRHLHLRNYINTAVSCIHIGATTTKTTQSNKFILDCATESQYYYLKNYTRACRLYMIITKALHSIAKLRVRIKSKFI